MFYDLPEIWLNKMLKNGGITSIEMHTLEYIMHEQKDYILDVVTGRNILSFREYHLTLIRKLNEKAHFYSRSKR